MIIVNDINGDTMDKYLEIVNEYKVKEDRFKNNIIVFIFGGLMGIGSELLIRLYIYLLDIPRKDAGVLVIGTLIVISSLLTGLGVMDSLIGIFKSALIIPITGFAHSITASSIEYKREGLVLGIGSNIFKLAGSVILYGIIGTCICGFIRIVLMGV